jgi:hypothetical protein
MIGPNPVIHKLINGILQSLIYLLIGALDLLTYYLHIAPELLALQVY